jgi:hypothetical protein
MLLRHFGCTPVYSPVAAAKVITVGSLLQSVPTTFSGTILGSGFIEDGPVKRYEAASILLVRGELTRSRLGVGDVLLGDPGLLASRLVPSQSVKRYSLGIVAHYADREDARIARIARHGGAGVKIIDVRSPVRRVLREVAQCQNILSSSLHGLIVADAYGIPNRWIALQAAGDIGDYKFRDYFSSLDRESAPLILSGAESVSNLQRECVSSVEHVSRLQQNCETVFREFVNRMRGSTA